LQSFLLRELSTQRPSGDPSRYRVFPYRIPLRYVISTGSQTMK
jgi:hypothetical protein